MKGHAAAQPEAAAAARERIMRTLDAVKDPEIPVISVVELGVVRDVELADGVVTVTITPTYSGCPAMHVMEEDITAAVRELGFSDVRIRTVLLPAWTSDWINEGAREKLRRYGIAPPSHSAADALVQIGRRRTVECPFCGSMNTLLTSEFGSTACKALHRCKACSQPFEEFKTI